MNASPTLPAPVSAPCGACGSPLASDQRYCLTCGARSASARLPFLQVLREDTGRSPAAAYRDISGASGAVHGYDAGAARTGSLADRVHASSGLIAGVGVLLLAMLIGVLLGTGLGRDDPARAVADPAPVVVSVAGGPAAAAVPTDAVSTTASTPTGTASAHSRRPKKKAAAASIKTKVASPTKLKALSGLSGRAYQKQVDKLGKNIAVGGKAPPKDNKPAAGGGSFQEIG